MSMATIADKIVNFAIIILGGLLISGIIGLIVHLHLKRKRYKQFKCVIWGRDGFGQLAESQDEAGIFVDSKTKNKRFYMFKNKVGLNADSVPYVSSGKDKIVYLYQTGLKNFHFIKIGITEPAKVQFTVGEEDVNWGINSYERAKKMFSQSLLMQLMPYIMLAFVSLIILVLFIYLFRQFGALSTFIEKATIFIDHVAAAQSGTTVIQG